MNGDRGQFVEDRRESRVKTLWQELKHTLVLLTVPLYTTTCCCLVAWWRCWTAYRTYSSVATSTLTVPRTKHSTALQRWLDGEAWA